MSWEAKKLDDTYSGIYKNGELVRVNVETTDAEFFVEALAACAAGEWRYDVENAPKETNANPLQSLADEQVDPVPEFDKVLADNFWELMETTDVAAQTGGR